MLLFAVATLSSSPSLKALSIFNASHEELLSMASLRGIDTSHLGDEEIRALLYEEEGVKYEEEVIESEEGESYSLEVLSADSLSVLANSSVRLSGNVSVAFSLQDGTDRKILSADEMIVASHNSRLSVYGSVSYKDEDEKAGISNITADAVSFLWNEGSLFVSGGTTSTERSNNEDEKVTFYTSGELLNYRSKDSGLFFNSGYITSNVERAYSSISASSIALLEGGDMFLSNAFLSIGRVPILYLPFFFFPGSRMVGNPAFGFTSKRGMFLSTTFELFGSYPISDDGESSSFTSILKSDNSSSLKSNGLYYEEGESEGLLSSWANASKSYFAILADIYEEAGLSLGYDTSLILFDKALKISSSSSYILSPINSVFNSYGKRERYYSLNSVKLSATFGSLSLDMPFYSDPEVLSIYGNRLTGFAIDSLFGAEQKFPSKYSSTITNYRSTLSGSLSLPSKYKTKLLDSLSLSSLRASAYYTWDNKKKRYDISDVIFPSFSANASGTIFSFSTKGKVSEKEKEEEKIYSYTDYFLLSDPLLYPMYIDTVAKSSSSSSEGSSISLIYSLSEDFSHSFDVNQTTSKREDGELSSQSSARFTLSAKTKNYFDLKSVLTPSYSYNWDEDDKNSKNHNVIVNSANTLAIPILGLTYELSLELYRYRYSYDDISEGEKISRVPSWEKDRIKSHSITLSKAIATANAGTFTPSIKYNLPPLTSSLEPRLSWSLSSFSAALSWAFKEDENKVYRSDDIRFSFGYSSTYFTYSLSSLYQSELFDRSRLYYPLSFTTSASIRTKEKDYYLTTALKFDGSKERKEITSLSMRFSSPYAYLSYNTYMNDRALKSEYIEIGTDIKDIPLYTWKNRIIFSPVLSGKFHYDFEESYSTYMTLSVGFSFKIQEFLDFKLSLKTGNNSFYRYYENNSFNFGLMWDDLMRSFDFFGSGRRSTSFNMESISAELVHYMGDWDLHCKYSAEVVSSSSSYSWVPEVAVYLRWKTLPDLKVDQNWEHRGDTWVSGGSNFD